MGPDVSNTKANDTKKSYESSTKDKHHASTNNSTGSTTPPKPPENPQKKPITRGNKGNSVTNKQISSYINKNLGKIGLYSAGFGVARAFVDGDDDDILTTAGKAAKTSALTTGTSVGVQMLVDHLDSDNVQLMDMFKKVTVSDYAKTEAQAKAKSTVEKAKLESRAKKAGGKLGTIWKVGLIAAAGATVIDGAGAISDNRRAKREEAEKEYDLKQKQKQRKKKDKQNSYGAMQDGELLFELFDGRSGHHKMGNAKFM